ncbi:MAG: hypothetical protein C4520_20790 [Candidatus Abyssobacteria bacterium SURF_5]|uniref:Lipoprotein n=1 Tax=Abyssobacteria bacterium (strain SURF_5) TaxID=2093360 RepID=A0A3A4N5M3_ABYX5|nr:MAG: hypothetical protein C4520_20790 [Candidatus Abyssubacteria bacterium SURF_5]
MKSLMPLVLIGGLLLSSYGCSSVGVAGTISAGQPTEVYSGPIGIPPGHLPPPGQCRIWYPGFPPGQQPPPGHCDDLEWRVPPGAWLIYGPSAQYNDFVVAVYDERQPGVVISVQYYDTETGRFLKEEKGRGRGRQNKGGKY